MALVAVVGCSSPADGPDPQAASSSSNPAALPTPAGTVPDSIEDINSTKDMTGVVTTYSDHENPKNPYFDLIPYVCPFLPDSLTREKLGMETKRNAFGGQHSLLQVCDMSGPSGPNYEKLAITVRLQATSFADVSDVKTHTNVARNVPISSAVNGTLYKNAGDDGPSVQFCNLAWGTFYGSAVITVSVSSGYRADPCAEVRRISPQIAKYLPSQPIQMRPTEG